MLVQTMEILNSIGKRKTNNIRRKHIEYEDSEISKYWNTFQRHLSNYINYENNTPIKVTQLTIKKKNSKLSTKYDNEQNNTEHT